MVRRGSGLLSTSYSEDVSRTLLNGLRGSWLWLLFRGCDAKSVVPLLLQRGMRQSRSRTTLSPSAPSGKPVMMSVRGTDTNYLNVQESGAPGRTARNQLAQHTSAKWDARRDRCFSRLTKSQRPTCRELIAILLLRPIRLRVEYRAPLLIASAPRNSSRGTRTRLAKARRLSRSVLPVRCCSM